MTLVRSPTAAGLAPLYVAVALGAFLLFLVQPMAARFILPWFGGGPAVWSTCLLFFQVALLAGYLYAHLTRRLGVARQARLHLVLLLLAALTLPIAPSAAWSPSDGGLPSARILLLLAATVGAPYVVLAATAPLMQDWYARGSGAAPYHLYALSNAGSLVALLAYPTIVEPFLPLRGQSIGWSILFVVFGLVCGWSTLRIIRAVRDAGTDSLAADPQAVESVPTGDLAMWILWSACGSGLLLAATNQLCQDIAVVPLLWIIPLVYYLLTFILCFGGAYHRSVWALPLLGAIALAVVLQRRTDASFPVQITAIVGVLAAGCMVCHGELVRIRPVPSLLTSFYLAIAAGGSLGGLSVALIAPAVFNRLWEYPLFVVLPLPLLMIALYRDPASRLRRGAYPIVWIALLLALFLAVAGFATAPFARLRWEVARARNFYGLLIVADDGPAEPVRLRRLYNGRIIHGAQFLDPIRRPWATTYYGEESGVEIAISQHPRRKAAQPLHIGVVGLGVGTIAAWGNRGDTIRFFEINPMAETFARRHFTYLADTRAAVDVVIGDARLSIERELRAGSGHRPYDVLAIDAFSSDAIPVHLLTREAFARYAEALAPGGILAVHVSNKYLDLRPVVRGLAGETGTQALEIKRDEDPSRGLERTTWMLVTRNREFAAAAAPLAEPVPPGARTVVWTDAFSSILGVLKR